MADLEAKLKRSGRRRFRMIATDGVFSMDGYIANLPAICELADKHDAAGDGRRFACRRRSSAKGRGTHEFKA